MNLIITLCLLLQHTTTERRPNIIFMFGDDVGFNDMQFTSNDLRTPSTDTLTPNLNKLASEGVLITNYYVHRMCSPSRAAFLSGRLAFRYSMNTFLLSADRAVSLTRQVSLISEEFKAAGYATHAIGKWHLGYQSWEYTPTYRGFDSFYGYYNGMTDYYLSNLDIVVEHEQLMFFDLRNDEEPIKLDGDIGDYSIYRFRDQAITVIQEHAQLQRENTDGTPFFLYLAWQSSHLPSEAPDKYYDIYSPNPGKTKHRMYNQAQTTSMDDAIAVIVDTLKETNLWQNTLFIWSSDNGAMAEHGDNFPLRGYKKTTFEGGIRVPAFISGGYLPSNLMGTTYGNVDSYVHVTDWYPTLLAAAGIEHSYAKSTLKREDSSPNWETVSYTIPLDGISQWNNIMMIDDIDADSTSKRLMILDLVRNSGDDTNNGTVRWGKWKYIRGLGTYITTDGDDGWLWDEPFSDISDVPHLWGVDFANLDVDNALGCDLDTVPTNIFCFYTDIGCLFNIESDPCEYTDLSDVYPDTVAYLYGILQDVGLPTDLEDVATLKLTLESNADLDWLPSPEGFWGPWQKYENVEFETYLYESFNELYLTKDTIEDNDVIMGKLSFDHNFKAWFMAGVIFVIVIVVCVFNFIWCNNKKNKEHKAQYGSMNLY